MKKPKRQLGIPARAIPETTGGSEVGVTAAHVADKIEMTGDAAKVAVATTRGDHVPTVKAVDHGTNGDQTLERIHALGALTVETEIRIPAVPTDVKGDVVTKTPPELRSTMATFQLGILLSHLL